MKINNISNTNFTRLYRTEELLSFINFYKGRKHYDVAQERDLIKFMTGFDPLDRDTFAKIHRDYNYDEKRSEMAIHDLCGDEIIRQNPILRGADETSKTIFLRIDKDENEIATWFKRYLNLIGKTLNVEPFKVDKGEFVSRYKLIADFSEDN